MKMKKSNAKTRRFKLVKKGKIAAIAGLTLTAGMVLSDIAPAVAATNEQTQSGATSTKNGTSLPDNALENQISKTDNQQQSRAIDTIKGQSKSIYNVDSNGTLTISAGTIKKSDFDENIKDKTAIKSIVFTKGCIADSDINNLFAGLTNLTTITGWENLDLSKTTNMSYLFQGDTSLKDFLSPSLNLSNVTTIEGMFANTGLEKLDLSKWTVKAGINETNLVANTSSLLDIKIAQNMLFNPLGLTGSWYPVINNQPDTSTELTADFDKGAKGASELVKNDKPKPDNSKITVRTNIDGLTVSGTANVSGDTATITPDASLLPQGVQLADPQQKINIIKNNNGSITAKDGEELLLAVNKTADFGPIPTNTRGVDATVNVTNKLDNRRNFIFTVSGINNNDYSFDKGIQYPCDIVYDPTTKKLKLNHADVITLTREYFSDIPVKNIATNISGKSVTGFVSGRHKVNEPVDISIVGVNPIPGYKVDPDSKTITGKLSSDGTVSTETSVKLVTVTGKEIPLSSNLPKNKPLTGTTGLKDDKPVINYTIPAGYEKAGTKVSIDAKYDETGNIVPINDDIISFMPIIINDPIDVSIESNTPGIFVTASVNGGKFGDQPTVTLTDPKGYEITSNRIITILITFDPEDPTKLTGIRPTNVPAPVVTKKTAPSVSIENIQTNIPNITVTASAQNVTYDEDVALDLKPSEGYEIAKEQAPVKGHIDTDKDNNLIITLPKDTTIKIKGKDFPSKPVTEIPTNVKGVFATGTANESEFGKPVTITVDAPHGYSVDQGSKTIQAKVKHDGTFSNYETANLSPIHLEKLPTSFETNIPNISVSGFVTNANFGDKDKTVTLSDPQGYTIDDGQQVHASVVANDKNELELSFTNKPKIQISPKMQKHLHASVKLPDGTTEDIPVRDAKTGETVTVNLKDVEGYVHDQIVTGIVQPDGTIKIEHPENLYKQLSLGDNATTTVDTKEGKKQTISLAKKKYNSHFSIDAEKVDGYDLDSNNKQFTIKIDNNGNASVVSRPTYNAHKFEGYVTINAKKDGKSYSYDIPTSVIYNQTTTVALKEIPGYDLSVSSVEVQTNNQGTFSTVENTPEINYTKKADKTDTININILKGTKSESHSISATASATGYTKLDLSELKIPGYKPTQDYVYVHLSNQGKVELVDPQLIVNYVPLNKPSEIKFTPSGVRDSKEKAIPVSITYDSPKTIDVPYIPGYTADTNQITVTLQSDGETIKYSKELKDVKYSPKHFKNHYVTLNTNLKQTVNLDVDDIAFDEIKTVTIKPDLVNHYHTDTKKIELVVDAYGNITQKDPNQKITFTSNNVTLDHNTYYTDPEGARHDFDNVTGEIGQTLTFPAATVQGYDLDPKNSEVEITIGNNGTPEITRKPVYTPTLFNGTVTVHITKNGNPSTVAIPVKMHYKDSKKTVNLPPIDGYTPTKSTVDVTVNPFGNFIPDNTEPIIYNLKSYTNNVTIHTSQSDKTIKDVTLHYGESKLINVPKIDGYRPNQQQVAVHLDKDNRVVLLNSDPKAKIIYSPIKTSESEIHLTLKLGDKTQDYKVLRPLEFNNPSEIEAPKIIGYAPKTKSILVGLDQDGNVKYFSGSKIIEYTPVPTPSPSTSSEGNGSNVHHNNHKKPSIINEIKNMVRNIIHRVTTLFHRHGHGIKLYNANFQVEGTRSLSAGSDWYSDQEVVHDGKTYYRVSKNEYVAAEDIYAYENKNVTVTIKADSNKSLVNSQGKISNRMLAKNTAWHSDRTIQINGKTYYRVSTDEFVSADDVIVK